MTPEALYPPHAEQGTLGLSELFSRWSARVTVQDVRATEVSEGARESLLRGPPRGVVVVYMQPSRTWVDTVLVRPQGFIAARLRDDAR